MDPREEIWSQKQKELNERFTEYKTNFENKFILNEIVEKHTNNEDFFIDLLNLYNDEEEEDYFDYYGYHEKVKYAHNKFITIYFSAINSRVKFQLTLGTYENNCNYRLNVSIV